MGVEILRPTYGEGGKIVEAWDIGKGRLVAMANLSENEKREVNRKGYLGLREGNWPKTNLELGSEVRELKNRVMHMENEILDLRGEIQVLRVNMAEEIRILKESAPEIIVGQAYIRKGARMASGKQKKGFGIPTCM